MNGEGSDSVGACNTDINRSRMQHGASCSCFYEVIETPYTKEEKARGDFSADQPELLFRSHDGISLREVHYLQAVLPL